MPSANALLTEHLLHAHLAGGVFASANDSLAEDATERIGIEVEFFPLIRSRLFTPEAQPEREKNDYFMGLYPWLLCLAERREWERKGGESGATLAFGLPDGGVVTLEPGGQIEYSTPPFGNVEEALEAVERFESMLSEEGERVGLMFASEGYNHRLGECLPRLVVRKPRYLVMDQHFERIGPFGQQMMRQTCATQINLDFGPPEVAAKRWRLANLMAPALNAIFANSPRTLDGIGYRSYRYEIWRRTDPSRTGVIPGLHDSDPPSAYLQFALNAKLMLLRSGEEAFALPERSISFRDWMEGREGSPDRSPDIADWECHLSTLFPHVRPRGFLEIRSIDALPAAERRAAVILATELLYNPSLLDVGLAICAGRGRGANGFRTLDDHDERFLLGKQLLEIALEVTGNEDLRRYHAEFTSRRLTPADRMGNDERRIRNDEYSILNGG